MFDGFETRGRVKAALNRLRSAEASIGQKKAQLVDDAQTIGRQLKYHAIGVDIANQELQSARNHLNYITQQFDRGEAAVSDMNSATVNLLDSWRTTMQARLNYWLRVLDFLQLVDDDPFTDTMPSGR
ncbi:MAG: TolC family protein [Candidatus Synoicihabitans palmerolidicus]|nr:TolC family protein [Candidatus Synoicihabitans palmerolidicus]